MKVYPLMPVKILYDDGEEIDAKVVAVGCNNGQITVTSKQPFIKKKIHGYGQHSFWWVDYHGRDSDRKQMSFTAYNRTRSGMKACESHCLLFLEGEF